MINRRSADVAAALLAKGMTQDERHHHVFIKKREGVTTLMTHMSHSRKVKDIGPHLGKRMANQCCLQLKEFWLLVDCPLDEAGWDALVDERCADGRNPFLGR